MTHHVENIVTVDPTVYVDMFYGRRPKPPMLSGVCGRVIRGAYEHQFDRLVFTEGRRLAWVMGPTGMNEMIGKSGADIVLGIGKSRTWLQEKLSEGIRWKLVVIPQEECLRADWDGLFAMLTTYYPDVMTKLLPWVDDLKDPALLTSIDSSLVTSAVKDNIAHPMHMSVEHYLANDDTPQNARLFLWHSLGANEQFIGTGYTRGPDSNENVEEFLMPNRNLSDIPHCQVIDLDVS